MKTQQININPNDLKDVSCKCGSILFTSITRLKYVSVLQSPDGNECILKMTGLVCMECGATEKEALEYFNEQQKQKFDEKVTPLFKQ